MNYFLKNFSVWKKKNIKKSMTLEPSYFYWCNTLLEYCIRLFTWYGLPDDLPQHEIEVGCITHGYSACVKIGDNKFIAPFNVGGDGITDYYDIFTHISYSTPLHTGRSKIGEECVIIPNNSLKMPLLPKIQRYSTLLAHNDISINTEFVNDRNSVLFEAVTPKQAVKAKAYQDAIYNGETEVIVNAGLDSLKVTDLQKRSTGEIEKLLICRSKLLQAFFEEIGIRKTSEKKERMITDETNGNEQMLSLNITSMLESRQKAAESLTILMGRKISVSSNIDYLVKNNKDGVDIPNE